VPLESRCTDCPVLAPGGAFGLREADAARLAAYGRSVSRRRGEHVVRQGDPRDGFRVLRRGVVRVYLLDDDGNEHTVRLALPGELVSGCSGGRNDLECYSAVAETEEVEVCHFPESAMERLLEEFAAVRKGLVRMLEDNLAQAYERLHGLAFTGSRQRLARLLLRLAERQGSSGEPVLMLPRQHLADLLGVTRETAVRALTSLREQGLVRTRGRQVILADLEGLRRVAMGERDRRSRSGPVSPPER